MYNGNDVTYTEKHSVSFGDLYIPSGQAYYDFNTIANTWTDWHLIPSSRPSVAHPTIVTKFVEIPGADGMLDLTEYLAGKPIYGQRQGSMQFVVVSGIENWETIREKMVRVLHGKKLKMRLLDDPTYYYDGRYTVGQWESGAERSSITISYQLEPYKLKINTEGSTPMLWDPFNFERDYDYYTAWPGGSNVATNSVGAGTYYINAGDYAFQPVVTWVSGSGSVSFGGVTQSMSSSGSATLGPASNGRNTLTITGTLRVNIVWRGGEL